MGIEKKGEGKKIKNLSQIKQIGSVEDFVHLMDPSRGDVIIPFKKDSFFDSRKYTAGIPPKKSKKPIDVRKLFGSNKSYGFLPGSYADRKTKQKFSYGRVFGYPEKDIKL